jgi:uncharacterized membrane protein YgdD (TMEM256/DUF423 family)
MNARHVPPRSRLRGGRLGAFGAHAIKPGSRPNRSPSTRPRFSITWLAGALGVGILMAQWPTVQGLAWTAWLLIAGLFSAELYAGADGTPRRPDADGGAAFIAAWLILARAALRQ